jgi:hypothetical protein
MTTLSYNICLLVRLSLVYNIVRRYSEKNLYGIMLAGIVVSTKNIASFRYLINQNK